MNSHFLKLLGPWNNNELNNKKEFGASDIERYNKRNDMLKLHFNRFNNLYLIFTIKEVSLSNQISKFNLLSSGSVISLEVNLK